MELHVQYIDGHMRRNRVLALERRKRLLLPGQPQSNTPPPLPPLSPANPVIHRCRQAAKGDSGVCLQQFNKCASQEEEKEEGDDDDVVDDDDDNSDNHYDDDDDDDDCDGEEDNDDDLIALL